MQIILFLFLFGFFSYGRLFYLVSQLPSKCSKKCKQDYLLKVLAWHPWFHTIQYMNFFFFFVDVIWSYVFHFVDITWALPITKKHVKEVGTHKRAAINEQLDAWIAHKIET
jgi:hypothetical protein